VRATDDRDWRSRSKKKAEMFRDGLRVLHQQQTSKVVRLAVWVSEATIISRKMPNQPIVTIRALPNVIDNFQIPPLPNSIQFKPADNPLAQKCGITIESFCTAQNSGSDGGTVLFSPELRKSG